MMCAQVSTVALLTKGVNINRLEIDKTAAFRDRRIAFRAEGVGIGHH